MKSILQENKECYTCGSPYCEDHHIFFGRLRKISERYGLKVWLCTEHHKGNEGPHLNRAFDIFLKKLAQREFLKNHTMDEWMKEFGRNFLD